MEKFLVKVHNRNNREFVQTIDEKTYKIPARGFIELNRTEAMRLFHSYSPIKRDGVGNDLEPKALELEFPKDEFGNEMRYRPRGSDQNRSMLDGKTYPSADALVAHILANSDRLDNKEAAVKSLTKKG